MVYAQIKAKLPGLFPKEQKLEVAETGSIPPAVTVETPISPGLDTVYRRYQCLSENPLTCVWTQKTLETDPTAKKCVKCSFPAILPPKTEIRGYRGRYRIDSFLGQRGMGRLYEGIQVADQQPVVIKEYLLPQRAFNLEETRDRKQAFERLAGLSLADGRVQDIRLILPWDAIADPVEERCYLITGGNQDTYPTLRTYLTHHGAMSETEVYHVLNQVLQTLQFLHGQKFSLPSGQVQQGIAHGNLSLDSLLLIANQQEFFTHVCDLAVWESLFLLPNSQPVTPTFDEDLQYLGYVAFYLLSGATVDSVSNQPLDPKLEQHWPSVRTEFKAFILRLLKLDKPFVNAEEARQALIQITPVSLNQVLVITTKPEESKKQFKPIYWLLLSILGLIFLGSIIWLIIRIFNKPEAAPQDIMVCCLKDVPGVPPGTYTYTGEKSGTWSYILQQSNLILQDKTLEDKLKENQPKLEIYYQPEEELKQAIAKVQSGKSDFAVTNLVNQFPDQIRYKEFAYDGLVVFVAFSYYKREQNLPKALNGQISIEQLRDLYTGKIKNWNQINSKLPNLPVKLYMPMEEEAENIFKERVLKDHNAISTFTKLQQQNQQQDTFTDNSSIKITRLPTLEMLRRVLQEFEKEDIGSIGFATLSQVFGQCSVYPLAVVAGNKQAVQSLVQNDTNKAIDPNTDLCNDKGSYSPNIQVFKTGSYPLSYPIVVIYPGDNSRPAIGQKFADMLKTEEAQNLLQQAGLVPLQKK
ncbi:substrate-binding domain-containing protein [Anabaena sp. CCY 9402-a]|uniref:substrate-binding domain-containing protein n=1 Tax=Anabaena sp. CCY 9402-a TaxID=3103867 RepID=UPI0039C72766